MTSFDRFERSLPTLFDELAAPRVPDYFDDLLTRTQATRQRPEWVFPERWLPVTSFVAHIAPTPRIPWRLGAMVALLAIAAVAAALVAGALLRPSNIGPGRNGEIIMVNKAGEVVAADPASGRSRTLISAANVPANSRPIVSPDGKKFPIVRPAAPGSQNIFVVDLQGKQTLITPDPLTAYHYIGWSPMGDRVLLRDDGGRILLLDAETPGPAFSLSKSIHMGTLWVGANFNPRTTNAFRPPYGDEIMFMANDMRTLAAIRQDGTGLRTVLDVQRLGVALDGAQWSPDGRTIAFVLQKDVDGPYTTWLVDADGSNVRPLSWVGAQWSPMWSPDGKRIAFEYWTPTPVEDADWDAHPIAVVDVATGALHEVGAAHKDGYLGWEWSPDGKSILEVPRDGFGKVLIVDATSGTVQTTPWDSDQAISWQRLAPN
jgi:dipeptidyl aminopeptidase/acylaminoacyl peptidase